MIIINEDNFLSTYSQYQQELVKQHNLANKFRNNGMSPNNISKKYNISKGRLGHWYYHKKLPCPLKSILFLKENQLLPLKMEKTNRFKTILRIFAWIYGDGTLGKSDYYICLSGQKEDLEKLSKEIERYLKFKTRITLIKTDKGSCYHLEIQGKGNRIFGRFLASMGAPVGDKVLQSFYLPTWLVNAPRWIKIEFLNILLSNEMRTPKLDKHKISIKSMSFRLSKDVNLVEYHKEFLNQLKYMLTELETPTSPIFSEKGIYRRKDGKETVSMGFNIMANHLAFLKFANIFNLEYCKFKEKKMEEVQSIIKDRIKKDIDNIESYNTAIKFQHQGYGLAQTARKMQLPYGRIKSWYSGFKPRFYNNFEEVNKYVKK
jgi:hypothetical protein